MSEEACKRLEIRPLAVNDLQYPLALCQTFHWPLDMRTLKQVSQAAIFLGAFPRKEDVFLFNKQGAVTAPRLLGTIALFPQGLRWTIGYVLVDPAYHRHGIGTVLMKHGIRLCRDDTLRGSHPSPSSLWLSATTFGAPVYQRLGFKRHQGTLQLLTAPCGVVLKAIKDREPRQDISLHTFDPATDAANWSKGVAFAGRHTSRDLRATLHASCFDKDVPSGSVKAVFCLDKSTSLEYGFGIIRPYGTMQYNVGPIIASDMSIAQSIFCQLIMSRRDSIESNSSEDVVGISASSVSDEWLDWLTNLGLEMVMPAAIMSLDLALEERQIEASNGADSQMVEWCYVDPGSV